MIKMMAGMVVAATMLTGAGLMIGNAYADNQRTPQQVSPPRSVVIRGQTARASDLLAPLTASFPSTQIFSFNEGVGLLNTKTGEVFELRGNLDNPSVELSWFSRVQPVDKSSGFLQVQRAEFNRPDAVFLVDVVRGDTWILRDRGNKNHSWNRISKGP